MNTTQHKYFFLLLLSFCLLSCVKTQIVNDLADFNLKGRVKIMSETKHNIEDKFGILEKVSIDSKNINSFNQNGNITEERSYSYDGDLIEKTTYNYDKINNLVEIITTDHILFKHKRITKEYNEKNLLIAEKQYEKQNNDSEEFLYYNYTYKYDKVGNLIEVCNSPSQKDCSSKTIYEYNSNGLISTEIFMNSLLSDKITGKMAPLSVFSKQKFEYDSKKRIIEVVTFNSKSIFDLSSELEFYSKENYEYDRKNGLLNKKREQDENDKIREVFYKYEKFDSQKNWIEQTQYIGEIPYYVITREIEYY